MHKYATIILALAFISTAVYAFTSSETLSERVERENRETLIRCLDEASRKSTTQEVLQAKNTCSESILTKIIVPTYNTWTVTSASSEVPKQWITGTQSYVWVAWSNTPKKITEKSEAIVKNVKKQEPQKSSETSSSFWTTYDLAIPLIRKHEWLRLKAYPDPVKCSIWYGTRAKSCSEVITQAEADRRLWSIVKQLVTRVQRDFPTLSPKQQAWLVSFSYNCEIWYKDLKKRWLDKHKYWCKTVEWKTLQCLVNRRLEEQILIFE